MSTKQRTKPLPAELPERPVGYTRQLLMHLSLGTGGSGSYVILDADGEELPIGYVYMTNRRSPEKGYHGYHLHDATEHKLYASWAELRQAWAKHYCTTAPNESTPP